jgi:hypothetical protein
MNRRFGRFLVTAAFGAATMAASPVTTTISNIVGTGAEPYTATVGGVSNVEIICDDDYDSYKSGVTYDVLTLASLSASNYTQTMYGSAAGSLSVATKLYDEIAYLALQFAGNSADTAAIQGAIWDIFYTYLPSLNSGNPEVPLTGSNTNPANAVYWYDKAQTQTTVTQSSAIASQIELLTPTTGGATCRPGQGCSQEFIRFTTTPEPATYALYGMGLILLSLGTFRRRKNNR